MRGVPLSSSEEGTVSTLPFFAAVVFLSIFIILSKGVYFMANRMILNETSYHGAGAIQHIVDEVISRSFKKALVVTDKDLIKFNVVNLKCSLHEIYHNSSNISILRQVFTLVAFVPH